MPEEAGAPLDAFSRFYAVVLANNLSDRIRWSPPHRAWVGANPYVGAGRNPWLSEPRDMYGRPVAPPEDTRAAALSVAMSVLRPAGGLFFCQRCWQTTPEAHFIAMNVYGDPALYCVQVPALSIVGSFGGNGEKKHWGHPFGCQFVHFDIDSEPDPGESRHGPLAAHLYGRPLPAEEVINRDWCSRCTGRAYNVRANAEEGDLDVEAAAREAAISRVRNAGQALESYFGKR